MHKTQAIFRAVIRAGLYAQRPDEAFMCHALRKAEDAGIISPEEMGRAKTAIQQYMRRLAPDASVLRLALLRAGFDYGGYVVWVGGAGRDFYWSWDKRPRFPKD